LKKPLLLVIFKHFSNSNSNFIQIPFHIYANDTLCLTLIGAKAEFPFQPNPSYTQPHQKQATTSSKKGEWQTDPLSALLKMRIIAHHFSLTRSCAAVEASKVSHYIYLNSNDEGPHGFELEFATPFFYFYAVSDKHLKRVASGTHKAQRKFSPWLEREWKYKKVDVINRDMTTKVEFK
jgi:hypothetical protein